MNLNQAKSIIKAISIVLGIVGGVVGLVIGLICLVDNDRQKDEQFFCAPQKMEHVFMSEHTWHAVCIKDGSLYLSDKSKK